MRRQDAALPHKGKSANREIHPAQTAGWGRMALPGKSKEKATR